MKPTVVVGIPLVWGVRNVMRSGLAERLAEDFHLVYAVPAEGREGIAKEGIPESDIWTLQRPAIDRRTEWVQTIMRRAHRLRHPTPSDRILAFVNSNGNRRSLRRRLREIVFLNAARTMRSDMAFTALERAEWRWFGRTIPPDVFEFLNRIRPVAGLSTSCVVDLERPLFQAMRSMGIPTATHMLSFDNLTSRSYLPLRHFSRYFLWQESMAAELARFYGIGPEGVAITGTPQFDFHVKPEFRWTRAKTLDTLGLRPDRPYFVYCANHYGITPSEPTLVDDVLTVIGQDPGLRDHQWVLRLHPMDKYSRWADLEARFQNVVVSRPWRHGSASRFWAVPSEEEIALLGNTLRYADATVTIASTVALDSAVVDTPVVCLGFHPRAAAAENRFYRDAHYTQHYRPVMETGATPIALDMGSLQDLLAAAVRNREALRAERSRLVRTICGGVDGKAADRIAHGIAQMVATGTHLTAVNARPPEPPPHVSP